MWWKTLSVVLIIYTLITGLLVPLKSGIQHAEPAYARTKQEVNVRFYGYNTFLPSRRTNRPGSGSTPTKTIPWPHGKSGR